MSLFVYGFYISLTNIKYIKKSTSSPYATESQKFHWFSNLYKRKQSAKQQFISQLVMLLFFLTRSSHFLQSLLSLDKDSRHVAQTTSRCLIFKEKVHTFHIFNLPLCFLDCRCLCQARLGSQQQPQRMSSIFSSNFLARKQTTVFLRIFPENIP